MKKKTVSSIMMTLLLICLFFTQMETQNQAEASARSDVYIYIEPHIIPAPPSVPSPMIVTVYIDSPDGWDNTPSGIVGWALGVRVDPRVIQVVRARRAQPEIASLPTGGIPAGFLENFLVRNGHTTYHPLAGWSGYQTWWGIADIDPTTGTMVDISEQIQGFGTLGVGAGGGPYPLCEFLLIAQSNTDPSVIDLFGPPRPPIIEIEPMYLTVDGAWYDADVVDDGYYIAETPETMYFSCSTGFDPANPLHTDWHELWPQLCNRWTLESWEDQGDGVLSESDRIDMVQTSGPELGKVIWGHVEWVNPDPCMDGIVADCKASLIIRLAEMCVATMDIDPDTLNLHSRGQWITAYIQLPEDYNAEDVDATTILLNETIQPVFDPKYDFVTNPSEYLVERNGDGIFERMVKFNRAEVASWVFDDLGIQYGDVVLSIRGELVDGTPFEGTVVVRVLFPGDVDGDGYVGSADAGVLAISYGSWRGDPLYVPEADFDEDGYIGSADAGILSGNYGKTAA